MNTLAQMWQDFESYAYKLKLKENEQTALEYRMLFYTGFHACLDCMGDLAKVDLTHEEKVQVLASYHEEYKRMAMEYITQRQRGQ